MSELEVFASYSCGHPPRAVCGGRIDPKRLDTELARVVQAAVAEDDKVHFNCHCGRGAARLIIRLDGRIISNEPVAVFQGLPGVSMSQAPRSDTN